MINVNEAWKRIKATLQSVRGETLELSQTNGRTLLQPVRADRDYPPFDRVAMDGYALSFTSWNEGQRKFPIQDLQTAGQPAKRLFDEKSCIEIMTGASLPGGCDLVIRYEDTERSGDEMIVTADLEAKPFTNVHRKGEDCAKGTIFGDKQMNPPLAALAASFGMAQIQVARTLRIAIIGTGDELVAIDKQPLDYQIRASNIHAVRMALEQAGHAVPLCVALRDDRAHIARVVTDALQDYDLVLLSGGVSAGKTDFIPSVLADCGVETVFHKIAQRPGKPLWFGKLPGKAAVFGLPGNPMSTLVCVYRYVLPYLRLSQGLPESPSRHVELKSGAGDFRKLTVFAPVRLSYGEDAKVYAELKGHHGSGDFASLSETDGFIEIPGELEPGFDRARTIFTFTAW